MDLFSMMKPTSTPLADRMRPRILWSGAYSRQGQAAAKGDRNG